MKKTILGLVAFVALATTSCTKENKEEAQPATTEAVTGAYTITKVEATVNGVRGDMTSTYFSNNGVGECAKDDITTFAANGMYTETEGTVMCNPPTNNTGTWAIENGTLKMNTETLEIEYFSGRTLRISEIYNGTDKIYITYSRK